MPLDDLTPTLKVLYALWLAAVGGATGSFLNVVVYRVPAGLGLVTPGSHCPACKRPIPLARQRASVRAGFGFAVGAAIAGRKISARYPIVEALAAAMFFVLGWVEVLGGATSRSAGRSGRRRDLSNASRGELLGIGYLPCVLLCTLLAAALIEWDGHRLPVRVVVPALVVGLVAPVVWPHLHPVPAWQASDGWLGGLADGAGGSGRWAGDRLGARRATTAPRRPGLVWATGCVGLFLGYQAVVSRSRRRSWRSFFSRPCSGDFGRRGRSCPRRRGWRC